MIQRKFSFIPRIGEDTEKKLARLGITNWDHFLENKKISGFSDQNKAYCDEFIEKARKNLLVKNHLFFQNYLKEREHWLLYDHFKLHTAFLDIETTGLSRERNRMTTLSIWDGKKTETFINGINMDHDTLAKEFDKYKMFVTFNGTTFDIPFIKAKFPELCIDKLHIDLRWLGYKIGLRGGLKRIEKDIGINREGEVADINGLMAVRLWKRWEKHGDKNALDLLVKYNQEDVINLEKLADMMTKRLSNNNFYK